MNWLSFEHMDWLAMLLIHSLWIAAGISVLVALGIRIFRITESKHRYLIGVGSMAAFVVTISILTLVLLPGSNEQAVTFNFDDAVAFTDTVGVEQANTWVSWLQSYSPVFLQTWFLGMVFLLLRLIGGYHYLNQIKRKATLEIPDQWLNRIEQMSENFGITKSIQVLGSNHIDMPMVYGHLKPVMLLPVSMLSGLTQDQLEAIFAHEIAHIRRHDYLVNLAQSVVEAIFFFNPFIWWLSSFINQEREQCCDDMALAYCGNPVSYARALSGLEESRTAMLAMGLGSGRKSLLERIRRIVEPEYTPATSYRVFVVALLLSLGFLSFRLITPQENDAWIDVKNDYGFSEELIKPRNAYAGILAPGAQNFAPVSVKSVLREEADTLPLIEEQAPNQWMLYSNDTAGWAKRYVPADTWSTTRYAEMLPETAWRTASPEVIYQLDTGKIKYIERAAEPKLYELFVSPDVEVEFPDASWGTLAPFFQGDTSRFPFYAEIEIPDMSLFDVMLAPSADFDFDMDFEFDDMNFMFAPGLYVGDTTKLSETEREAIRKARAEIRAAQEEIRKVQIEHRERLREEMKKLREVQREEWELHRQEMRKMQEELRKQLREMEPLDEEEQKRLQEELRKINQEQQALMIDRAREMEEMAEVAELARVQQLEAQQQMELAREEMKLAQREMQLAADDMALARKTAEQHKDYHRELETMLRKDGYLSADESLRKLKISEDSFEYNGKKIDNRDLDKYLRAFEKRFGKFEGKYIYSE